jgi:hypothetical protein
VAISYSRQGVRRNRLAIRRLHDHHKLSQTARADFLLPASGQTDFSNVMFVLFHFSRNYRDEQIRAFFDEQRVRYPNVHALI